MNKKDKNYNWWTDPENAEEVRKASWWDHDKNKTTYPLPISVVQDGKYWVASTNEETKQLLGESFHGCAQGKTKEEAVNQMFLMCKILIDHYHERELRYHRWVPLEIGPWKSTGGKWITIFGINIYFRYGKKMSGGWFVPFTYLNIRVNSLWETYRRFRAEQKEKRKNSSN